MKEVYNVIILFMIVITLPYLIVVCFTGFVFNMNSWSETGCIMYIVGTIILGGLISATYYKEE